MNVAQLNLTAFVAGAVVPIEAVPDPVFAGRMMGDGIAIDPANDPAAGGKIVVHAPCDGQIAQLHSAYHACFITSDDGACLLLHIGIDTVLLKGEGFVARVAEGERVRAGQALIEFDLGVLRKHGKPAAVILVIENGDAFPIGWRTDAATVAIGDALLAIGDGVPATPDAVSPLPETAGAQPQEHANGWATVRHAGGLHARPCAMLVNALKPFAASVEIRLRGATANARSVTAMMGLAVGEGDEVEISSVGVDAGDALVAAIAALETPSGDDHAAPPVVSTVAAPANLQTNQLAGVVASPGLAMGIAARLDRGLGPIAECGEGEAFERRALGDALQGVIGDIEAAVADAETRRLSERAGIFAAHRALVEDPELLAAAEALIARGKSAAFAWHAAVEAQCATLAATGNALLVGRVNDLRDVERQVLRKLTGTAQAEPTLPPGAILLADDLLPSDFPALERAGVRAVVTAQGGPTSHIAILARAQGIPALVAVGPQLADVAVGMSVIVDADRGIFEMSPSQERRAEVERELEQRSGRRTAALARAHESAVTTDGVRIEVAANIATADDARQAVTLGAESVGLVRTELLFMERAAAPSVDEQRAAYQDVLDALEGRPAIFRTLDVGADKSLAYLPMPHEDNPALGLRGIRLCLSREALLVEQMRALVSLQPMTAVRIMLPMVCDVAEIVAARAVLDRLAAEAGITEGVQLGVMIETPAAALLADQLAQVADFFSLGTNDLTQYTLCMDRTNPALAARVDGMHPAVLRLIAQAAQGAASHGKWLGVCGATASDPLAVPLLIGLGATELSVSPAVIPEIKAAIRRLDVSECRKVAQAALQANSPDAVRALVRATWPWLI